MHCSTSRRRNLRPSIAGSRNQIILNPDFANTTLALLRGAPQEDTGTKYLAGYKAVIEKAEKGMLPPLGIHILMGETASQKTRNAARNIEEGRTHPIQVICRKR